MSKAIKKLLLSLFNLCIEASKTCNYFINCDYTAPMIDIQYLHIAKKLMNRYQ
ncbi:hypothetical protein ACQR2L_11175 [Clostridium butyricum]|uniref:hypothetical protein n=1 Tax=Clostridium butyricum TaxID=1492 RepID=UPI003D0BF752